MCSQGFEHLPDWLEGRLEEHAVGVFGLVDEDRNHDGADLLARGFADHAADGQSKSIWMKDGQICRSRKASRDYVHTFQPEMWG